MVGNVTNASHNEWPTPASLSKRIIQQTLLAAEPRVEIMDNLDTAYERAKELFKKYPNLKGYLRHLLALRAGRRARYRELGLKGKAFGPRLACPTRNKVYLKDALSSPTSSGNPQGRCYAHWPWRLRFLKGERSRTAATSTRRDGPPLQFAPGSTKCWQGKGWITITKDNVDSFGF